MPAGPPSWRDPGDLQDLPRADDRRSVYGDLRPREVEGPKEVRGVAPPQVRVPAHGELDDTQLRVLQVGHVIELGVQSDRQRSRSVLPRRSLGVVPCERGLSLLE